MHTNPDMKEHVNKEEYFKDKATYYQEYAEDLEQILVWVDTEHLPIGAHKLWERLHYKYFPECY